MTIAYYVSTPTGSRCLTACREHGFREMSCPVKVSKGRLMRRSLTVHLERYALDNGAWLHYVAGVPCDFGPFAEALGDMGAAADFVVVPDLVAGGQTRSASRSSGYRACSTRHTWRSCRCKTDLYRVTSNRSSDRV